MLTTRSQRWRDRRARFVDDLTVIDPRDFAIDQLDPQPARRFVAAHHYLPNYPAAQVAVGLFGKQAALVGVAVFAMPSTASVITRHTGFTDPSQGTTLARFFLLPERSEEHTSELQSLMRISYAVFCLKKNKSYARQAK